VVKLNRRSFLGRTAMAGGAALMTSNHKLRSLTGSVARAAGDYGPLIAQPSNNTGQNLLRLPAGFQYTIIGKSGTTMADGRRTPSAHDGMAAFDVYGMIHLVRNHELEGGAAGSVAFGSIPYDPKALGGTTTVVVDPVTRTVVYDFASLSGTVRNCAGGPTPWGSWLTCEETTVGPAGNNSYTQPHGYIFEIPAANYSESPAIPFKAMGRFSHEAVAVDPATGVIYETEDANPSGFYRFIPNQPGFPGQPANLSAGGLLQMLAVAGQPGYDTRTGETVGVQLNAVWVNIDIPDPGVGQQSTVNQGIAKGGARFARLEGAWHGNGSIYFVSTSGGNAGLGQVWKYTPTTASTGILTLVYESASSAVLEAPDNLHFTPRGGILLCEDGGGLNFVRGLTPAGTIFDFVVHNTSSSECAGATFSQDGQTLFFNYQGTGETFAVWPRDGHSWEEGAL
jgi:secreted PhoX family phosphatase